MAGVGLICGSLALDLRRQKLVKEIVGYGRSERQFAFGKTKGIIDRYFLREDEFPGDADFLMLGTPVETIVPLTKTFLPKFSAGCIDQRRRQRQRRDRSRHGADIAESIFPLSPAIRSPAASNGARKRRGRICLSAIAVF